MYPYSDGYMIFNNDTKRYVLTEADVMQNLGINLTERVKDPNAINSFLNLASLHVYRFIHQFNTNNDFQDYVIAKTESGRKIIKEAMEQQLVYLSMVGDLSRSANKDERMAWFDPTAEEILMRTIPEIGCSVCYSGQFKRYMLPGEMW